MDNHSYVMVVDENQEIMTILNRLSNLAGKETGKTNAGETALQLLGECQPNLVILDIEMPEIDSNRIRELIEERSGTPVIVLTARCEVTTVHDALLRVMGENTGKLVTSGGLLSRLTTRLKKNSVGNISKN